MRNAALYHYVSHCKSISTNIITVVLLQAFLFISEQNCTKNGNDARTCKEYSNFKLNTTNIKHYQYFSSKVKENTQLRAIKEVVRIIDSNEVEKECTKCKL